MTAPALPSLIWIVVTDYGKRLGAGSSDFRTDKEHAASEWADNIGQGMPSRVLEINLAAGTSRDCTDECEAMEAGYLNLRAAE